MAPQCTSAAAGSSKVSAEHLDSRDACNECRICLEAVCEDGAQLLIRPCRCDGTLRYAHVSCLNEWARHCKIVDEHCTVCSGRFRSARRVPAATTRLATSLHRFRVFVYGLFCLVSTFHLIVHLVRLLVLPEFCGVIAVACALASVFGAYELCVSECAWYEGCIRWRLHFA